MNCLRSKNICTLLVLENEGMHTVECYVGKQVDPLYHVSIAASDGVTETSTSFLSFLDITENYNELVTYRNCNKVYSEFQVVWLQQ
jgi:hypothetical protein